MNRRAFAVGGFAMVLTGMGTARVFGATGNALPLRGIEICFDRAAGTATFLVAQIRPLGCFSSSCTRVARSQVRLLNAERPGVLDIIANYELRSTGQRICTRDCARLGVETLAIDRSFAAGRTIAVNGKMVGQVPRTGVFKQPITCFIAR